MIRSPHPSPPDPAHTGLKPAGDGNMWLDRRFRAPLGQAGLLGFERVMDGLTGRCLRTLDDRENWHLKLPNADRQSYAVYLKKHHVRTWRSRLRAALAAGPGDTAGRVEARNVQVLAAEGIHVMKLVAYGEKLHLNGRLESFVLTEELAEYLPLDDLLRRRFAPHQSSRSLPRDHDLERLIRRIMAKQQIMQRKLGVAP